LADRQVRPLDRRKISHRTIGPVRSCVNLSYAWDGDVEAGIGRIDTRKGSDCGMIR